MEEPQKIVVNGEEKEAKTLEPQPVGQKANRKIYLFGYTLRLLGIPGTLYVLIMMISSGGYFFLIFLGYAPILLPSLLLLAVGHYLASNWKE